MTKFTFVELFAGIGGVSFGLEKIGGTCLMAAEYDPQVKTQHTQQTYKLLHPHVDVRGDVFALDEQEVPDHDLLSFTTPCQSFSIAGKRLGFEDIRGTLVFEALRIAKHKKPRVLLMENVKGLVGHDGGKTLDTIIHAINDIGYTVDFEIINSKYYVPQNRERVFLVGIRDDLVKREQWQANGNTIVPKAKRRLNAEGVKSFNLEWPEQTEVTTCLRDYLEDVVDEKHYITEDQIERMRKWRSKQQPLDNIRELDDISPTLTARGAGNNHSGMIIIRDKDGRLRNPSPLECWRLQGFSDEAHDAVKAAGISDSQRYKMAGNAVSVPVISAIGKRLLPYLDKRLLPYLG